MRGLAETFDCAELEHEVDDVALEAFALFFGQGVPFLLDSFVNTLMASSRMTSMKTLVSSTLEYCRTLSELYQK